MYKTHMKQHCFDIIQSFIRRNHQMYLVSMCFRNLIHISAEIQTIRCEPHIISPQTSPDPARLTSLMQSTYQKTFGNIYCVQAFCRAENANKAPWFIVLWISPERCASVYKDTSRYSEPGILTESLPREILALQFILQDWRHSPTFDKLLLM